MGHFKICFYYKVSAHVAPIYHVQRLQPPFLVNEPILLVHLNEFPKFETTANWDAWKKKEIVWGLEYPGRKQKKKINEKRHASYAWWVYFHEECLLNIHEPPSFSQALSVTPYHLCLLSAALLQQYSSSSPTLFSPDFPNLVRRRLCPREWLQTTQ